MKPKIILIASILWLTFFSVSTIRSQWVQANGPYGGSIRALAVEGANIYAASNGSGVFRSTDNGESWKVVNIGLTNLGIKALAVSATNLFAGTFGGGIFRSTDSGRSWVDITIGITGSFSAVAARESGDIFVGTNKGVFRSTDNGSNWQHSSNGLKSNTISSLLILDTNILPEQPIAVFFFRRIMAQIGRL